MDSKFHPAIAILTGILATLIMIVLVILLLNSRVGGKPVPAQTAAVSARFARARVWETAGSFGELITDTKTGVQYLFVKNGYSAGLVKLEDPNV